jgi:hypothetical protein
MHSADLQYLFPGHGPCCIAAVDWLSSKEPNQFDSFGVAWHLAEVQNRWWRQAGYIAVKKKIGKYECVGS